jgi:hypothetical protein
MVIFLKFFLRLNTIAVQANLYKTISGVLLLGAAKMQNRDQQISAETLVLLLQSNSLIITSRLRGYLLWVSTPN